MTRIRQATEGGDFTQALSTTESEVKAIEDEEAFNDSHEELASLIPQIAQGLAKQAEQAPPTSEDSKKYVESAQKALELCNNVSYVPKGMRDENKLAAIRDTLDRVQRRQQSQFALANGLKAMEKAVADGKPMEAYAAQMTLVQEHPELASESGLADALKKTAAAEQSAIHFVSEKQAAETTERPTPWVAALAVASHPTAGQSAAAAAAGTRGTACVRVDGAVYGLDAATGRLLWRRYVGFASIGWPVLAGPDVYITDSVRHELMRLDASTGRLIWRQTFKEPFAKPLLVGDRAYIAADSGRLYVVDLKSGARTGYLQFPQPLRVAPAIDRLKTHLYLAGNRASLYAISLPDMKCIGAYFLGHAPNSIEVSPVVVMDKLAVVENNGVETCRLHLLAVDDKYVISKQQANRRLTGLVKSPPLVAGRNLIVVTDRGQMEVYDISAGGDGEPLTLVAARTDRFATSVAARGGRRPQHLGRRHAFDEVQHRPHRQSAARRGNRKLVCRRDFRSPLGGVRRLAGRCLSPEGPGRGGRCRARHEAGAPAVVDRTGDAAGRRTRRRRCGQGAHRRQRIRLRVSFR